MEDGSLPSNTLTPQIWALGRIEPKWSSQKAILEKMVSLLGTISLSVPVVLANLGYTCGFEKWPEPEAREFLSLLFDVTGEPLFHKDSQASLGGRQTGFPLDVSIIYACCPFDSFIFRVRFVFESRTLLELRADQFLLGCLCCQDKQEIGCLGPFPACGYVEACIPRNSCEGLIPSTSCAVGTCGGQCGVSLARRKCSDSAQVL